MVGGLGVWKGVLWVWFSERRVAEVIGWFFAGAVGWV